MFAAAPSRTLALDAVAAESLAMDMEVRIFFYPPGINHVVSFICTMAATPRYVSQRALMLAAHVGRCSPAVPLLP